jgi:hypothetical protein
VIDAGDAEMRRSGMDSWMEYQLLKSFSSDDDGPWFWGIVVLGNRPSGLRMLVDVRSSQTGDDQDAKRVDPQTRWILDRVFLVGSR